MFMDAVGSQTQIVGDELLVTYPTRVEKALKEGACDALLMKVNLIGSISEAIEAATMSQTASWGVMVSHRSGETEDSSIQPVRDEDDGAGGDRVLQGVTVRGPL